MDELPCIPYISEAVYGVMPDGREVKIWTLSHASGITARVTNYGAILVSLSTPDRSGNVADLTLGYDTFEEWLNNPCYFGATVGRYGNRIANGAFTLHGEHHSLAINNHPNGYPCSLHGGISGFTHKLWRGEALQDESGAGVKLMLTSPDGDEGYPGALDIEVIYLLTKYGELIWDVKATTKAPTVLNIIQHNYWNLSGDPTTTIEDHKLTLFSDQYLPTTSGLIPLGTRADVADTPLDFRQPRIVGQHIKDDFEALKVANGYDQTWLLHDQTRPAAILHDPKSGRCMTISTNQPAIQFYSGNFLDGTVTGKKGIAYSKRSALCLETGNWPDAPNQPNAPSSILLPGETYRHTMTHTFSVVG